VNKDDITYQLIILHGEYPIISIQILVPLTRWLILHAISTGGTDGHTSMLLRTAYLHCFRKFRDVISKTIHPAIAIRNPTHEQKVDRISHLMKSSSLKLLIPIATKQIELENL